MPLILYFRSPTPNNASDEALGGIRRIAEHLKWHVRDINMPLSPARMKQLVDYWRPFGIIFESGEWSLKVDVSSLGPTPIVFIDRDPDSIPRNSFNVLHDSVSAGQVAARELMLTNYGHFAFIPFYEQRLWSTERQTSFVDSLALNGLDCAVFQAPHARADTKLYRSKLRRFIAAQPKPCAIFAANDRIAESVLRETRELALRCPEDVAVLGADDYAPVCESTKPMLSSVRPDFQRGGELAALMLSAIITYGKNRYRGSHVRRYGTIGITHRDSTRVYDSSIDGESRTALDLIRREACSGLTAETVLGCYSCTRGPAARRFRRATGRSILEEIHAVQLERVKMMLGNKNQQLSSISDFCGFSSPHALRLFFLRETGMTMSEWRRRHT